MALKLISLNIEGKRHLSTVVPFLARGQADVVCLQEVFEADLIQLKGGLYPYHLFLPTWRTNQHFNLKIKESYSPGNKLFGIAILSRLPLDQKLAVNLDSNLPATPETTGPGTWNPGLIVAKTSKDGHEYTIANTHFTWTKYGQSDQRQHLHLKTLLKLLVPYPKLAFFGDFNAPRSGEIYQALDKQFTDHTPKNITTTLDPNLHYANREDPGKLKLVVDYLFTKGDLTVSQVEVLDGLSDHCAIVAELDHQP
jgi:endonuclease/exonuclease/phosphatase family metal-dependent hydrolase